MAENFNMPARGIKQAEQHFDRRRFAGTVGAEQAEHFAALYFKVHVIDRLGLGPAQKSLMQILVRSPLTEMP